MRWLLCVRNADNQGGCLGIKKASLRAGADHLRNAASGNDAAWRTASGGLGSAGHSCPATEDCGQMLPAIVRLLTGNMEGAIDRLLLAGQRLSPFRTRGPEAAVRQLRDPTRCGHTAFPEADIEVNARCLLLRGRGNKMTARPRALDDESVYAVP